MATDPPFSPSPVAEDFFVTQPPDPSIIIEAQGGRTVSESPYDFSVMLVMLVVEGSQHALRPSCEPYLRRRRRRRRRREV